MKKFYEMGLFIFLRFCYFIDQIIYSLADFRANFPDLVTYIPELEVLSTLEKHHTILNNRKEQPVVNQLTEILQSTRLQGKS